MLAQLSRFFLSTTLALGSFVGMSTFARESLPSLRVESTYTDISTKEESVFRGSGFLMSFQDPEAVNVQSPLLFAVTSAHLVKGSGLKITDSQGNPCTIVDQILDSERDIALIRVSGCHSALHFRWKRAAEFYTRAKFVFDDEYFNSPLKNEILFGPTNNRVLFLDENKMTIYPEDTLQARIWRNVVGDFVTNIEVFQGLSGSLFFYFVPKEREETIQGISGFNARLGGVAKASWRFFRSSKLTDPQKIQELLNLFRIGRRNEISRVNWVYRSGVLNQEISNEIRDASIKIEATGNGISIDSGNPGELGHDPAASIKADLENFQKSGLNLGMHFNGEDIIAFQVEDKMSASPTKPFLIYASLMNYLYLSRDSKRFHIVGSVGVSEDLRPYMIQRASMGFKDLKGILTLQKDHWKLDISHSILAQNLFVVDERVDRIWGWDLRNLAMLDLEDLELTTSPHLPSTTLKDNAIAAALLHCEVKAFGSSRHSGFVVANISKFW